MKKSAFAPAVAAALIACSAGAALAHATISPGEAANGASVKLAVTVPHGCDGAATDTVVIRLPEGFVSAKPQVKAGWTVEITSADYARAYELHGEPVTSGPVEVKWYGGSVPDDQFDEFVVRGSLLGFDQAARLPFVVTQLCGNASVSWDEVAGEGQDAHALAHPAPVLSVAAAAAVGGHDHAAMAMQPGPVVLGDLTISGAFTRATLPNAPVGGGFMTIVNNGSEADRLIAAASPVAGEVQLHEMKMDGDVMKMAELEHGIEIPAGETVTLAPGGLHLMFMGLKQAFVEGESIPVTLTFEKAGTVELLLEVGPVGAAAPMAGHAANH